jgi:hypothetical protein
MRLLSDIAMFVILDKNKMRFILFIFPTWSVVKAVTIAQLIQGDPQLSAIAAKISQHPEWSQPGKLAVFVPTNAALQSSPSIPSPYDGSVTTREDMSIQSTYAIVNSIDGITKMVFNNAAPGQSSPPAIEIRYGLASGSVSQVRVTS